MKLKIYTWLFGILVGEDQFKNRYFQGRFNSRKRWVLYRGRPESSSVPAEWFPWLHHTTDIPLASKNYPWQKSHRPNLTGTSFAHKPKNPFKPKAPWVFWKP